MTIKSTLLVSQNVAALGLLFTLLGKEYKQTIMFITTSDVVKSEDLDACRAILKANNTSNVTIVNREIALKLGSGTISPIDGFVMVASDGEVMRKWHNLARWLDARGLILLA